MAAERIPGPGAKYGHQGRYDVIICKSCLVRLPKARLDRHRRKFSTIGSQRACSPGETFLNSESLKYHFLSFGQDFKEF